MLKMGSMFFRRALVFSNRVRVALSVAHIAGIAASAAIMFFLGCSGHEGQVCGVSTTELRPAALTGSSKEIKAIDFDVIAKKRICAKHIPGKDGGLSVADYPRYAIVAILDETNGMSDAALWKTPAQCAAVQRYLDGGGTILLTGRAIDQMRRLSDSAAGLVDSPRIHKVKGVVYALRLKFAAARKPLGITLDRGEFQLTPEGEEVASLDASLARPFDEAKGLLHLSEPNEWEARPLGKPGTMKLTPRYDRTPVLNTTFPKREPGPVLVDEVSKAVVITDVRDAELKRLASELAWHLGEMTGKAISTSGDRPKTGPYIEIRRIPGSLGRSVVRTNDKGVLLGGESSGVSHSVTYFLEALGCRYLWPGKDGKIIPHLKTVVSPKIDLDVVPVLKIRHIRDYAKTDDKIKDHPGNRGFWAWHGVNDAPNFDGAYRWGHYFADYYKLYAKDHPEYFALQPNGSREQDLLDRPERMQLCLSSWGLARQTAENVIAAFRADPKLRAHSICLPDGGNPSECMCRECRKLDPVNAPKAKFRVTEPWHCSIDYVSFSDRVMTFNNRVAELVTKEIPYAKLTCYLYSNYVDPPVSVKPHPALVLISDSGNYVDAKRFSWAYDNVGCWRQFGNMMFICPCSMWGFRIAAPQNFSRRLFADLELFKANGVEAADYDCMNDTWAAYGLVYYMAAKGMLNFDRIGYDALLDDYCQKGFGAAAGSVGKYFKTLEDAHEKAARSVDPQAAYLDALDFEALDGILLKAEAEVAGDAAACARVRFLRRAIPYARCDQRVSRAWAGNDISAVKKAQAEAKAFRDSVQEVPLVFRHSRFDSTWYSPLYRPAR